MFIFVLGAQKNRLTEHLYLTYALVGPAFIRTELNAHTLPATDGGIQWRGGGGGFIFCTDPVGVGHGRNWPRVF